MIYGAILLMYSTNSVCNNCTFSIIENQMQSNADHITVKTVLMNALTKKKICIDEKEFKMISMVSSDKAFSVQSKIFYGVIKRFPNLKAKIYLDDDSIDVRKLFKNSKCEKMIIECISPKNDQAEKKVVDGKQDVDEKQDEDEKM